MIGCPVMTKQSRSLRSWAAFVSGGLVLVTLAAACTPEPPPPVVSTNCAASFGVGSAQDVSGALSADEAAAQIARDFTGAVRSADSREVQVVIAATTEGGLEIRSVPAATLEQATAVARAEAARGTVLAIDLDAVVRPFEQQSTSEPAAGTAAEASSDPERPRQWALDKVPFEAAWDTETGHGVVVAVTDSGIDAQHPDLALHVLPGVQYVGPSGIRSGNGQRDSVGHGTHVAGIIGALVGNSVGITGAVNDVRLLPVKIDEADGTVYLANIARGVVWAADNGAQVINMSLGVPTDFSVLRSAIAYAKNKGVVVVAAAGNNGHQGNARTWPAAYPDTIAVAATTLTDARMLRRRFRPTWPLLRREKTCSRLSRGGSTS